MNYAIIECGGKQYKVLEGTTLEVDRLSDEVNSNVIFDKVLLFVKNGKVTLGAPYISDLKITGKVISHDKGDKVEIYKFRAKSKYRRHTGFRHSLSQVKIDSLGKDNVESNEELEKTSEKPKKSAAKKKV